VVGLVPPVQKDQIPVDLRDSAWVLVHDVAPDHRALAALGGQIADAPYVLQEHAAAPQLRGAGLGATGLQVPGLVAVGVEEAGAEVRQVLVVEVRQQLVGSRVGRRDRPAGIAFGQGRVTLQGQDVRHVPQRLEARDELHVVGRGVGVHPAHGLGVQRRVVGPDLRMAPEVEGVLHVQHEHVELHARAAVDQLKERLGARHLAPAGVEHHAAVAEVGLVADAAGGKRPARLDQLGERLHGPAQAGGAVGLDLDALGPGLDPIGLSVFAAAHQVDSGPQAFAAGVALQGQAPPRGRLDPLDQQAGAGEVPVVGARAQHDGTLGAQREPARQPFRAARFGQERRQSLGHGAKSSPNAERPGRLLAQCEGRGSRPGRDERVVALRESKPRAIGSRPVVTP